MFVIHVFDEVHLAREDATSLIATVVPSVLSDPEDLTFAGSLIVLIKTPSGVKVAARRTANFNRVSKTSFSIGSFLILLFNLLFANFVLFQVLIDSFSFRFSNLTFLNKSFGFRF